MTYGTNDGSTIDRSDPPSTPPAIVSWNGSVTPADHGPASADAPPAPNVPGGSGGSSGTTAVNTPSIALFATNMDALIEPLNRARDELAKIDVRSGAFHQAFLMADRISKEDGLKGSFDLVLRKLIETVTDVRDGARKMAADYETTEEANEATAKDLAKAMPDLGAWPVASIGNGLTGALPPPTTTGGGGDLDALLNAGSGLGS